MKKLFFAALLATVAIGSSYAQYTKTPGGSSQFNCLGADAPSCRTQVGLPIYPAGSSSPVGAAIYDQQYID